MIREESSQFYGRDFAPGEWVLMQSWQGPNRPPNDPPRDIDGQWGRVLRNDPFVIIVEYEHGQTGLWKGRNIKALGRNCVECDGMIPRLDDYLCDACRG